LALGDSSGFFKAVRDFEPDVILLDYLLPRANGGELCRQLKELDIYKPIPVIIFSAYFNRGDGLKPGGCDSVLYKPFDLESLLSTVRYHLAASTA